MALSPVITPFCCSSVSLRPPVTFQQAMFVVPLYALIRINMITSVNHTTTCDHFIAQLHSCAWMLGWGK